MHERRGWTWAAVGEPAQGWSTDAVEGGRTGTPAGVRKAHQTISQPAVRAVPWTPWRFGGLEPSPWTDELVARLVKLWNAQVSAALIARELGFSRNAVIGKVYRLRHQADLQVEPRDRKPIHVIPRRPGRPRPKLVEPQKPMIVKRVPSIIDVPPGKPVALADLERWHCRWVLGEPSEMLFCGARCVDGRSYCVFHVKQAYVRGSAIDPRRRR